MKRPRVPHLTQTYIFWRVLSSICNRLDSTFLFPRFWSTSTLSKAVQRLTINTPPSHTRFHIVQVFSGCRVARASLSSPAYYPTTLVAWLCPASSTQSYRKWKNTSVAYLGRRLFNNPLGLINAATCADPVLGSKKLTRPAATGQNEAFDVTVKMMDAKLMRIRHYELTNRQPNSVHSLVSNGMALDSNTGTVKI